MTSRIAVPEGPGMTFETAVEASDATTALPTGSGLIATACSAPLRNSISTKNPIRTSTSAALNSWIASQTSPQSAIWGRTTPKIRTRSRSVSAA